MEKFHLNRRSFVQTTSAAALTIASPAIWTSKRKSRCNFTGNDEYKFEIKHDCVHLPDKYTWQTTHNVAVDFENNLYVIHEGRAEQKDHPAIFVFDSAGNFVRAFGSQFQGGGHGIEVRKEGSDEFLYVAAYQQVKSIAKLTLTGETVWQSYAPMDAGIYAEHEDTRPDKTWGRDRFMPTNFAFTEDGGFFLADGYGSFLIHRYDKEGKWQSSFGGPGQGNGKFNTPHGLWIDRRIEDKPLLVVTDRAHNTLQRLDLDGNYVDTIEGLGLPANIDTYEDLLMVPELLGRISLWNNDFDHLAVLGDDKERVSADKKFEIRRDRSTWKDGKFIHPHDACFDLEGNIFCAEWVAEGRVSKLIRV